MTSQQKEDLVLFGTIAVIAGGLIYSATRRNLYQLNQNELGEFFPWDEFVWSDIASQYNLTDQWNPPELAKDAGQHLAQIVLDPVRRFLGLPIIVNSWWRSDQLNDKLIELGYGAAPNSWHKTGGAVDATVYYDGEYRTDLLIRGILASGVPFKRLLIEKGTDERPQWVQIEYDRGKLPWNQDGVILRTPDGANWVEWSREYTENLYL